MKRIRDALVVIGIVLLAILAFEAWQSVKPMPEAKSINQPTSRVYEDNSPQHGDFLFNTTSGASGIATFLGATIHDDGEPE